VRNARRTARRHVRSWPSNESWWAVGSSRSGCRDCAGAIPATEGEPARGIYRAHRERLGRHLQVGDRRECSLRSSRRSCRNTPPTSMACASKTTAPPTATAGTPSRPVAVRRARRPSGRMVAGPGGGVLSCHPVAMREPGIVRTGPGPEPELRHRLGDQVLRSVLDRAGTTDDPGVHCTSPVFPTDVSV